MSRAPGGVAVTALDVHAHIHALDLVDEHGGGPRVLVDGDGQGRLVQDGAVRKVPATLWDVGERLRELDRAGVSHQVVSPLPAVVEHAWRTGPAYARAVNDAVRAACDASGGRLIGLGCLPGPGAPQELSRCVSLGLRGVEVGTRMGGLDLDAPDLTPVWRACADQNACVFVHPVAGGRGVVRRSGPPLDVGLGMLTDTAIAASALVFGGVLTAHPDLRVALVHGGGAFPWTYPRMREVHEDRATHRDRWDALVGRLYVDTLVFDVEHLRLLGRRPGVRRLLLGSDTPFLSGRLAGLVGAVDAAIAAGALPAASRSDVLRGNAIEFLGLHG